MVPPRGFSRLAASGFEPLGVTALSDILLILLLVLANGIFAGAEIAVVAVRSTRIQELVAKGRTSAAAVLWLKKEPERFLATVQVGITVIGATAAAFGGASIAERLAPTLARITWIGEHAEQVALGLVIALVSYLSIVIGELVPKSLALRSAERYALFIGRALFVVSWLARPLVWFLSASANILLKPFGDKTSFTETRHSAEELQQLVEESTHAGTIHREAGEIATRALALPELTAADVMVPRQGVVMVSRNATPDEIRRIVLEYSHTRMPVYGDHIDDIVGYLNVKDLLALAWEQRLIVLQDVLRSAYFVPESKNAAEMLREMRHDRMPFAIVVDEYGGMSGIVTMEDLVEELVGEIMHEHETPMSVLISKEEGGAGLVSGAAPIRDVNRVLGLALPSEGSWTTMGGLCVAMFGRIPDPGESLRLPDLTTLEVVDSSPRRVISVRVCPPPAG
ncbi:MAG: hemolysin family protein [Polyangiaceae bacterium]|nr:hemolysin family protein [Polyangiaceae bacterium]